MNDKLLAYIFRDVVIEKTTTLSHVTTNLHRRNYTLILYNFSKLATKSKQIHFFLKMAKNLRTGLFARNVFLDAELRVARSIKI